MQAIKQNNIPARQLLLHLPGIEEFMRLGRQLGETAKAGELINLHGPLGAGKTTLTQSIARGMGFPEETFISSPSFNIIHEYHQASGLSLFHLDLYRLDGNEDELYELGVAEYLNSPGLCVVEWPDRLGRLNPSPRLDIYLSFDNEHGRKLRLVAIGEHWESRLGEI